MSDQVGRAHDPAGDGAQPDAVTRQTPFDVEAEPTLPDPVRTRVVALTAAAMTQLPTTEIPPSLRRVAQFAPNRRARLGAVAISAQLATDLLFRQRVAAKVIADAGELGSAIEADEVPATADPVEVAALAYLLRPAGWSDLVSVAAEALRAEADSAAAEARLRDIEARAARVEHERALARVEVEKLRDETARLREELIAMRDDSRAVARELREVSARERRAAELLAIERGRIARTAADHEAEVRRLRARLAEAEDAAGATRTAASKARQVDDARLWLLLETIGQAASGLRRELALEPAQLLPADAIADDFADRPGGKGPGAS